MCVRTWFFKKKEYVVLVSYSTMGTSIVPSPYLYHSSTMGPYVQYAMNTCRRSDGFAGFANPRTRLAWRIKDTQELCTYKSLYTVLVPYTISSIL